MSKLSKVLLLLLSVLVLTQCKQDNWGSYYDRPAWLGPPIYQTLVKKGNFTMYLQCVDRTGYALDRSGSYTVFAPNDGAFATYLADKGYTSVADMSDRLATDIVAYSLVINPYTIEGLNRYEDATYGSETGAFKRQTMYYPILKHGTVRIDVNSVPTDVDGYYLDQNKLMTSTDPSTYMSSGYVATELNYKYYSYFLTENESFTAADYGDIFGDESRYTGRNAYSAQMIGAPISAENGWIYELDRVIEPVPSLDDYLQGADYSDFYSMFLDKGKISFLKNDLLTTKFSSNADYPGVTAVYVKFYSGDLNFAPNVELFTQEEGKQDAQKSGYTLFAPNNAAMATFMSNFQTRYGITFQTMLEAGYSDVLSVFLNNHMQKQMTWPVNSGTSYNEEVRLASNGIFYGRNAVELGPYFQSVYAEMFVNPKYLEMKRAVARFGGTIRDEMLNTGSGMKYTVLLLSNSLVGPDGDGMVYDPTSSNFTNLKILTVSGSSPISANSRFTRLIKSHIFKRASDAVIPTDFGGSNWKYAQNYDGENVRYRLGGLQAIGNIEMGTTVTPTLLNRDYVNGQVYDINRLVEATPRDSVSIATAQAVTFWTDRPKMQSLARIKGTAVVDDNGDDLTWYMPECSVFLNWLKNSKVTSYNQMFAINKLVTVLVPTNTAIQSAITDGFISGVTFAEITDTSKWHNNRDGIPASGDENDSLRILRQVQYFVAQHVITAFELAEDALPGYVSFYNSEMLQIMTGSSLEVSRKKNTVIIDKNSSGFLTFTSRRADLTTNIVTTDRSSTNTFNILMSRMMVHKIANDTYLKYDKPASGPSL